MTDTGFPVSHIDMAAKSAAATPEPAVVTVDETTTDGSHAVTQEFEEEKQNAEN